MEPGSYEEQNGGRESLEWSEEPLGQEGPRMMMVAVPDYLLIVLTLSAVRLHILYFVLEPWPAAG